MNNETDKIWLSNKLEELEEEYQELEGKLYSLNQFINLIRKELGK